MADELIFNVGIDVKGAQEQAIKDGKEVMQAIQNSLQKQGIIINVGVDANSNLVSDAEKIKKNVETRLRTIKMPIDIEALDFNKLTALISQISNEINKVDLNVDIVSDKDLATLKEYRAIMSSVGTVMREINKNTTLSDTTTQSLKNAKAEKLKADAVRTELQNESKVADELRKQETQLKRIEILNAKAEKAIADKASAEARVTQQLTRQSTLKHTNQAAESRSLIAQQNLLNATTRREAAQIRLNNLKNKEYKTTQSLNKEHSRQLTYVERLVERMGVYSSIYAIGSFIRNIRAVTAEFELQRVSLTAMLQSATEANELFAKTVNAAVESPYEIRELVQYTKQLAAFGVESEKLFDTTQMLADVTAGLGADFGRVALAYGQIRARGFLAGTELRQLTELGLAFPEMLAEQYSLVEKQIVTVGDVFDRISNREVTFGDVENIFKQLTEDGGRFYEMQAKQAKTISGLWSNLQDVISIMYADIGTEFYDEMRTGISTLKTLIENWETVANVVTVAGGAYGLLLLNTQKLNAAQKFFTTSLGEETVARYGAAKAAQAQANAQANVNKAVAYGLSGGYGKIPVISQMSEKAALRQAIATKSLTKEEAVRAIVLKQTTAAERKLMLQTGLLDKAQIKAALSAQALARGGTAIQRAMTRASLALSTATKQIGQFFASNWLTLAISGIIALYLEWSSKSKELEEEITRTVDAHKTLLQEVDKINKKYKDDLGLGVQALIDKYKELGLEGASAIQKLDLGDSLEQQYEQLEQGLISASKNIQLIKAGIAEGFGDLELGGLLGDNIKTDMEDLNKSISKLFIQTDIERTLAEFRSQFEETVKDLSDAEKQRYADILQGKRAYESELEYQQRLAKAYTELSSLTQESVGASFGTTVWSDEQVQAYKDAGKSMNSFNSAFSRLTSEQQTQLKGLSNAYESANEDIIEFSYEIEKRINSIATGLDIKKLLSDNNTDALGDIAVQIKAVFDDPDYQFNEFTKQIGAKRFGEILGIPLHFFAEFDLGSPKELNSIQQALVGSGLFEESQVESVRSRIDAQKALLTIVEKEKNLKEIIAKEDEDAYNTLMAQYKERAKRELELSKAKLDAAKIEQSSYPVASSEYKETALYIQQLQKAIANYNKQLEESQAPFSDFISKNKELSNTMSEQTKIAYEVAKAIGVTLDEAEKENGKGGGIDPYITLLKNRMSVMKDFQGGVQSLSKFLSENNALLQQQQIMASRAASVGINVGGLTGSTDELSNWYQQSIDEVKKKIKDSDIASLFKENTVEAILSTNVKNETAKAWQDLLQSLFNAKTDFDTKVLQDQLKNELSRLSNEIKNSQEAKDFYNNIFDAVGDEEIASNITVSVYGDVGSNLQTDIRKQIQAAFGADILGKDISDAVNKAISTANIDTNALKNLIPSLPESLQKDAKAIVDETIKENAREILELAKNLKKFKDYEDQRTDIIRAANQERIDIINKFADEQVQAQYLESSKKKEQQAIAEVDLAEFKATEEYIRIFEDLDKISTQTLSNMRQKLEEFIASQDNLSPEGLKELSNALTQIESQLIERNPFGAIIEGVVQLQGALQQRSELTKQLAIDEENLAIATAERVKAETNNAKPYAGVGSEDAVTKALEDEDKAKAKVITTNKKLAKSEDDIAEAMAETIEGINAGASAFASLQSLTEQLTEFLGVPEDSDAGAFLEEMGAALGIIATVLSVIAAVMVIIQTVGAPFMIIAAAIAAVVAAIAFFANKGVRDADAAIEQHAKNLEDLQHAYERLEKAAENALGADYIDNYNDRYKNLLKQQDEAIKSAQAERSKGKKAEQDEIDDFMNEAQGYADQAADMLADFSAEILGSGLADFAKEISALWLEAKIAGEDTFDALMEKKDELMQSLASDLIFAAAIEAALAPIFKMIDQLAADSSKVNDEKFWANFSNLLVESFGDADDILTHLYDSLKLAGVELDASTSGLTGISKDLATASEESILGLAAGINTQNYYISGIKSDTAAIRIDLANMIALLQGGVAPMGIDISSLITQQNTYLLQLPNIAQNTANTVVECQNTVAAVNKVVDRLDRVIRPKGTATTYVVKSEF